MNSSVCQETPIGNNLVLARRGACVCALYSPPLVPVSIL